MSFASATAAVLRAVAGAFDQQRGPAATTGAVLDPPSDVAAGLLALESLVSAIAAGTADLSTAEAAFNAIQKVAVNLGFEPPEIAAAITAGEWLLPLIRQAYTTGLVTGGVPAAFPPGGGPGQYRGR